MRSLSVLGIIVLLGCSGSKVTLLSSARPRTTPISTIALAPSGGVLADGIGLSLLNYDVTVFDTQQTSNLMIRYNLNEVEVMEPQGLAVIAAQGVDAILVVRSVAGYDDKPQSASVRLIHTTDGRLVGSVAIFV